MYLTGYSGLRPLPLVGDTGRWASGNRDRVFAGDTRGGPEDVRKQAVECYRRQPTWAVARIRFGDGREDGLFLL